MTITLETVEQIFRAADVEGFIGMGAPADEYNAVALTIAAAMAKLPTDETNDASITAIIALVWEKNFSLSEDGIKKRLSAFQAIAKKLTQLA